MSYFTWLRSNFGKKAIWLYEIEYGGTTTRYVAGAQSVTAMGQVWLPSGISHNRFRRTVSNSRAETEIFLPRSDPLRDAFLLNDNLESIVTIYHGFAEDQQASPSPWSPSPAPSPSPPEPQFVIKFAGRAIGTRPFLTHMFITCENEYTVLRRKALAAIMQRPCRHAVYHYVDGYGGCPALLVNFQADATLLSVNGNVVEVPLADNVEDGYYTGGILEWSGSQQMIVSHTAYQLTLLGPLIGLSDALVSAGSAGVPVKIAPGCDLTRQTCNDRFDALLDHGGFPWMNGETPFDGKTLY